MPTIREAFGCPICGFSRKPVYFGLSPTGTYDPNARPPKFVMYRNHFGGRANIRVEEHPMPLNIALGMRESLRTALAQIEQEITEAGGELPE